MAGTHINLDPEKTAFAEAVYGKDVRNSMVSLAEKIESTVNNAIDNQLIEVDDTLTESGQGAEASKTGMTFRRINAGAEVYTDYQSGYYSDNSNPDFPERNASQYSVESVLIPVSEGETFYVQGDCDIHQPTKYGGAVIFSAEGTVLAAWPFNNVYRLAVSIPEGGAYLASNTNALSNNSYVSKFNDSNIVEVMQKGLNWESGGLSDINGNPVSNVMRIRSGMIPIIQNKDIEVIIPAGYEAIVYKYDSYGEYVGYQTPWTETINTSTYANDSGYIRLVVRSSATPNADISDKVPFIVDNVIIRYNASVSLYAEDVQLIETVLNYYPADDITSGRTIDVDGTEITNASYKLTGLVAIPKKYNKNQLYTHAYSESGNASRIAFYNTDREFVGLVSSGTDSVQNLDTYAYVKVVYPVNDTSCYLSFTNETIKPDYEPPQKYLLYKNDLNSYEKNVITDGAVTAIINTALMYFGDEQFGYGTEHTAFAEECIKTTKDTHSASSNYEGERYQMDCSTYVMLMMMGITPACSRYFHTNNIPSDWGFRFNRLVEYEGYVYGEAQTGNTKRLYANSIAEYAFKNGYLYFVNNNLSNVRPGDIFFLVNQPASYNFFNDIGHCGMVVDTVPLENGGQAIITLEANGGATSPCKYHVYNARTSTMIYAARFPMPFVHSSVKNISGFSQTVTAAITGSAGDVVDVATVNLNEPLVSGKVYTLNVKCEIPANCYLQVKANGMTYDGLASESVLLRPDGYRTFRMFSKKTDIITEANSITLQVVFTGNASGSASLTMAEVFKGFVTPQYM